MKGACEFIGTDRTTKGDWVGKYGKDGYLIAADEPNDRIPSYAKVYFRINSDTGLGYGCWWDENNPVNYAYPIKKHENGMLYYDESKTRRIVAYHDAIKNDSLYINIDVGGITKYFTVYLLDFNMMYRITEIGAYDEDGILLLTAPIIISDFTEGIYVTFKVSGKVSVVLDRIFGQSVLFNAIFFDDSPFEADKPKINESTGGLK